jgi:RNA polymerase sigma-70 factor (ECF subfamily)
MLSRVKKRLELDDEFQSVSKEQHDKINELIHQFMRAFHTGNTDELFHLLSEDAVVYTDGGGKVVSAINPIFSRNRVVQLLIGLLKRWSHDETRKIYTMNINGQTGIVVESKIEPPSVVSLEIENDQIKNMFIVRNPDKLKYIGELKLD